MTQQATFDLVDQPWIPCIRLDGAGLEELSLRQVLTGTERYREISDPSPLVTVSLHRLLLAILHRSLNGPRDMDEWKRIWDQGWDTGRVSDYLDKWKHRFDLFDPDRPFYQTKDLEWEYATAVSDVVHGMTLGNYSTLFDHANASSPIALTAPDAARMLVGYQNFAIGGLITYRSRHDEPRNPFGAADAGLLTKSAVVLVTGDDLRQTLTLNLHLYSDSQPFAREGDDKPAWEREVPALGVDRYPAGLADLLTWQGRRMRFSPEFTMDGEPVVRFVVRMKGDQFPDREHLRHYETMVPFRKNLRATGNQPAWSELALRPDRALWRDSTALMQSVEDGRAQPKTTRWLADLVGSRRLERQRQFSLDLFGMAVDRANIFFWRHERLPLPLEYLDDEDLRHELERGLVLAEDVGRLFSSGWVPAPASVKAKPAPSPMRVLAANLASPADEDNADADAIRRIVSSLAPGPVYWSRLEVQFTRFMLRLADVWDPDDPESDAVTQVLDDWRKGVGDAARHAFAGVTRSLIGSGNEKAVARGSYQLERDVARFISKSGLTRGGVDA